MLTPFLFLYCCVQLGHCLQFLGGPWFIQNGPGDDFVEGEFSLTPFELRLLCQMFEEKVC